MLVLKRTLSQSEKLPAGGAEIPFLNGSVDAIGGYFTYHNSNSQGRLAGARYNMNQGATQ